MYEYSNINQLTEKYEELLKESRETYILPLILWQDYAATEDPRWRNHREPAVSHDRHRHPRLMRSNPCRAKSWGPNLTRGN